MNTELLSIFEENKNPVNKYGFETDPVKWETVVQAGNLLKVIPSEFPVPQMWAANDGAVNYEWGIGKYEKTLVLNIYGDGSIRILYIENLCEKEDFTVQFKEEFPIEIKKLLERMYLCN